MSLNADVVLCLAHCHLPAASGCICRLHLSPHAFVALVELATSLLQGLGNKVDMQPCH